MNIKALIYGLIMGTLMGVLVGSIVGFLLTLIVMNVYVFYAGMLLTGVIGFIVGYQTIVEKEEDNLIRDYELQRARRNL